MRLLLDTHIALWSVRDDSRLPRLAADLIVDGGNGVWVSAASLLEIAIKHRLRRTTAADFVMSAESAAAAFRGTGFLLLPILPEDVLGVEALPPHHADPFDRLIVAQALAGPYRLMTHDKTVARYSDTVILV